MKARRLIIRIAAVLVLVVIGVMLYSLLYFGK